MLRCHINERQYNNMTEKDPEARQHTVAEFGEMRQPLSAAVAGTAKLL